MVEHGILNQSEANRSVEDGDIGRDCTFRDESVQWLKYSTVRKKNLETIFVRFVERRS